MPSNEEMQRWMHMLQQAAGALNYSERPEVAASGYRIAKTIVDRVADQMYSAHQEAAKEAWGRAFAKREGPRHNGDPIYNEPRPFYEL